MDTSEPQPLAITTPRLLIRLATLDDVPSAYRIGADPRNTIYQPHMNMEPHSLERTTKWITSNNERYVSSDPKEGAYLAIVERSTSHFIGDTGQSWGSSKTGWTGVMLDYEKRGRGYAVEALWGVFGWSFAVPPGETPIGYSQGCALDTVKLSTANENREMRGVLERVFGARGEEMEAKNVEKRGMKPGAKEVVFTITKEEWNGGMADRVHQWLRAR